MRWGACVSNFFRLRGKSQCLKDGVAFPTFFRAFELRTFCIQLATVAQDCSYVRANALKMGASVSSFFFACVEALVFPVFEKLCFCPGSHMFLRMYGLLLTFPPTPALFIKEVVLS